MNRPQQSKWRRPYGQQFFWDWCRSELFAPVSCTEHPTGEDQLLEKILEPGNLRRALKRVRRNKGAPGVDRMTVKQLGGYLRRHWPKVEAAIREGRYQPLPVRRKEIEKPDGGGLRLLGIPTVNGNCTIQQQALGMG